LPFTENSDSGSLKVPVMLSPLADGE